MCDLFILSHSNFFQVQHMGCHQFFKCCCHVMSLSSRTLMLREISVLRSTFFSRWCSRMVTLLRQWTKLDQEHIIAQLQTNWFTGVMELQVIVHDFYMTMRVEFSSCLLLCKVVVILLMFWCVSKCIMHVYSSHTHTQPFNGLLSETTRVGQYQKKHSPTHTHPDHRTSFIIFLQLQRSTASSLFSLRAWQSSRTTSLQVLFGLPLGLGPSTLYSMHFFTHSSSFRSTCPYQRSLFCCNTNAMSSIPSLSAPFCWQTQW